MRKVGVLFSILGMFGLGDAGVARAGGATVEVSVRGSVPFGRLDLVDRVKAGDRARGGGATVRVSVVGERNGAVTVRAGSQKRVMQFERRQRSRDERVAEAKKMADLIVEMIADVTGTTVARLRADARRLREQKKAPPASAPAPAQPAPTPAAP